MEIDSVILSGKDCPMDVSKKPSKPNHFLLFARVHLALFKEPPSKEDLIIDFTYIAANGLIHYEGFADDFGPMNLASIFQFCDFIDQELDNTKTSIALWSLKDRCDITNTVFLVGSYMLLRREANLETVLGVFEPMLPLLVPYRDVSPGPQNFDLHVQECWKGLLRGMDLGWLRTCLEGFDIDEYVHLDSPLNADLHELVPDKFIVTLCGRTSHATTGPSATATSARRADCMVTVA